MTIIVHRLSQPWRPTSKEIKRRLIHPLKIRPGFVISAPKKQVTIDADIQLKLASGPVPFNLQAAVTARRQVRSDCVR
jgi:hypothetical protein